MTVKKNLIFTDLTLELPPLPASVLLFLVHRVPSHVPVLKLLRRSNVDELVRVLGDVSLVAEGEEWLMRRGPQGSCVEVRSNGVQVLVEIVPVVAYIVPTVVTSRAWVVFL